MIYTKSESSMKSVAIADAWYGVMELYIKGVKQNGIKLIVGYEMYMAP